jgi:hypothetical protein
MVEIMRRRTHHIEAESDLYAAKTPTALWSLTAPYWPKVLPHAAHGSQASRSFKTTLPLHPQLTSLLSSSLYISARSPSPIMLPSISTISKRTKLYISMNVVLSETPSASIPLTDSPSCT